MGCIEYQDSLKTAANVQSSYNGAIVTWWSFRELLPWYTIILTKSLQLNLKIGYHYMQSTGN